VDISVINIGPGDGAYVTIPDGAAVVIDLGTPLVVTGNPDSAYDLVYYEHQDGATTNILMDWVEIDLFNSNDGKWYPIFYWGNFVPDLNSTISAYTENDNEPIPMSVLYQSGGSPQTGILLDVDAVGSPFTPLPAGNYQLMRIYAPPGGAGEGCDVDAIQILSPKIGY
jgi:hypothetical protein